VNQHSSAVPLGIQIENIQQPIISGNKNNKNNENISFRLI